HSQALSPPQAILSPAPIPGGLADQLADKILSPSARVGIVGLGYVGLPLAVEFAKAGFHVTGINVSEDKTKRVNAGESYVGDIATSTLGPLVSAGELRATTHFSAVANLDTSKNLVPPPPPENQEHHTDTP